MCIRDRYQVDELTFRIWHTPGHTPGGVVIVCGDQLFSGDTLFAGSCGRVDLPGGSPVSYTHLPRGRRLRPEP